MKPLPRLALVATIAALTGCGSTGAPLPGHPREDRATAGPDTTTPHRYARESIGTAIVQDVRDGHLFFDFTPDTGETESNLRVPIARIDYLQGTVLEPMARLRLKLVRHYLQHGPAAPREIERRWELIRTR